MATELMQRLANISLVHVPYKGASGVMADLIAGHVDLAIMTSTSAISQLQAGRLRALAVASDKRISSLPESSAAHLKHSAKKSQKKLPIGPCSSENLRLKRNEKNIK